MPIRALAKVEHRDRWLGKLHDCSSATVAARDRAPAGPQTHWIGRPVAPEALAALPYAERRRAVADAIDALGLDTAPATAPRVTLAEVLGGLGGEGDAEWWGRLRGVG